MPSEDAILNYIPQLKDSEIDLQVDPSVQAMVLIRDQLTGIQACIYQLTQAVKELSDKIGGEVVTPNSK